MADFPDCPCPEAPEPADITAGEGITCPDPGEIPPAPESSFLVQLTAKTYTTDEFIAYSWVRVFDSVPPPVTYTAGVDFGCPNCMPAYHEQDDDLPVFPLAIPQTRSPRVAAVVAAGGSANWSDPDNAKDSDDLWATSTMTAGQETYFLVLTDFCFCIPTEPEGVEEGDFRNVTITGVSVEVEHHASGSDVEDVEVSLVIGGSVTGNNKATGVDIGLTDETRTYSGSPSSWGVTLDPPDVNASDFGVAIRYKNASAGVRTIYVDSVTITVTYTPAGGPEEKSIVRLRRGGEDGDADYYLIDQVHWEDLFRRTGDTDDYGEIGYHRYWDQNTRTWEDGREVRIVEAE